jgi:hypothetical protein
MMMSFFGLPGDRRVRLYLHALKGAYEKGQPLSLTADMEQLKNRNFSNADPSLNSEDVHPEWNTFRADVEAAMPSNTNEILNMVRLHSGVAANGSQKHFMQQVIKAHVDISNAATNLNNNEDAWHTATNVNVKDLSNVFGVVARGVVSAAGSGFGSGFSSAPGSGAKQFNYKLTKFILHQLLEQAAAPRSHGVDTFWTTNDTQRDVYFRPASNRDSLFTTDANGNKVDVSPGSAAYNNLANDQCIGTKVKQNGTNTCTNYIQKCIKGNSSDIQACKEFMQDPNFWDVVPREVDEMLPSIAENTLNSFGFKIVSKNNLREYESVGSWSRGLDQKGLSPAEVDSIRKNTKLTQYLEMLVTKINSNPAVLNKQYNAGYSFDPVDHNNRFTSWSLSARGIRPRVILRNSPNKQMNIVREVGLLSSSLLSLRSLVNNRVTFVPGSGLVVRGIPVNVATPVMFGAQLGGANLQMISAVPDDSEIREQYPLIKNLLSASETVLQSRGKSLDSYTKQQIEQHLESFRRSEEKLIKAIRYADKYIDLLDVYKEYDSENVLSIDHLKLFVEAREKYFDKTIGKQNDLLTAIERIATTINEALDNKLN